MKVGGAAELRSGAASYTMVVSGYPLFAPSQCFYTASRSLLTHPLIGPVPPFPPRWLRVAAGPLGITSPFLFPGLVALLSVRNRLGVSSQPAGLARSLALPACVCCRCPFGASLGSASRPFLRGSMSFALFFAPRSPACCHLHVCSVPVHPLFSD